MDYVTTAKVKVENLPSNSDGADTQRGGRSDSGSVDRCREATSKNTSDRSRRSVWAAARLQSLKSLKHVSGAFATFTDLMVNKSSSVQYILVLWG